MEIRNEELNNSKRGRSKSSSDGEKEETGEDLCSDGRESVSTISSSPAARTLPPGQDEVLEKNLFDAIFWRKQSLANNDMVCLVFIMMMNSKQQEVVGKTRE